MPRKRKPIIRKPEMGFAMMDRRKPAFAPVWIFDEITGVNDEIFESMFDTMKDAWDEIIRYLNHYPDRTTKNVVADKVRKATNLTSFPAMEFRRLYHLAWSYFNNTPQRIQCNPYLYKRIVGLEIFNPSGSEVTVRYAHKYMTCHWTPPEEYWDISIMPTKYAALEQIKDEKGNISYMWYVLCFELDVESPFELAKFLHGYIGTDLNIRTNKYDMLGFVPSRIKGRDLIV